MLGYAEFARDHTKEAITAWKHSLDLRPDAAALCKGQRPGSPRHARG
jgi:hypothetical protein